MFPNVTFLNLSLYWWMIIIGILFAFICFKILSKKVKLERKTYNFALITSLLSIVIGFLGAILFQSIYNYVQTGVFTLSGLTFSSGLVCAILFYIIFYFAVGKFVFKNHEHIIHFNKVVTISFPSIVLAHAIGRIGCLFAGCCYGKKTDSWIGIDFIINGVTEKRIPTQLFESIFLFLLFAIMLILILRFKFKYILSLYLISYGVWRFGIEFVRDDPRGSIGTSFLTPSQLISLIMIIFGIGIIFLKKFYLDKKIECLSKEEHMQ